MRELKKLKIFPLNLFEQKHDKLGQGGKWRKVDWKSKKPWDVICKQLSKVFHVRTNLKNRYHINF